MGDGISVAAPCKINLHLRVFDRRSDGFHDLQSVFQTLSFGDELRFESLKERSVCDLRMEGSVPPERNIVYKAVSAFRAYTGFDGGLCISVEKRVPMGAGLGGGSSDAAATLVALNALAGTALSKPQLLALASGLGSDVPFFLSGGTAIVTGRGEVVRSIVGREDYAVVLVHPGFVSDTARAYALLDERRASGYVEENRTLDEQEIEAALNRSPREWPFFNDFFPVLANQENDEAAMYRRLFSDLHSFGADFVSLSGSGSACFGVFMDKKAAARAVFRLSEAWDFVHVALSLACVGDAVLK